jgi:hypothetical protein
VFALDADSGELRSGWPVDLGSLTLRGVKFDSLVQNQRGALVLLGGKVFVPFGGHAGDCGAYHGWIVGIAMAEPNDVSAWVTRGIGGGVWAPGGIATDGESLYFATGNTEAMPNVFAAPDTWQDGEAIIRLPPSLEWSGNARDYFVPSSWMELDNADHDISGSNPLLLDAPAAKPASLVLGLGKNGQAYLLDRANLGGIGMPLAAASASQEAIIGPPVTYTTSQGTYVVFKSQTSCPVQALRIAGTPPVIALDWCASAMAATRASPAVTVTDDSGANAIVWIMTTNNELLGLDGETGAVLRYDTTLLDSGDNSGPAHVLKYQPPIVVGGRIIFAGNSRVVAFGL